MIIYPLPAQELDDKTLSKQIKNIAQVLCDIHHFMNAYLAAKEKKQEKYLDESDKIPLDLKNITSDYVGWGIECRANYLKMVEIGINCCKEYEYRNTFFEVLPWRRFQRFKEKRECVRFHELQPVIFWAKANVPDLKNECNDYKTCKLGENCDYENSMPFPLIPKKVYDHWFVNSFYCEDQEIKDNATILAYRNYYRAKIKKKLNDFVSTEANKEIALSRKLQMAGVNFTRREKPEWLNDL